MTQTLTVFPEALTSLTPEQLAQLPASQLAEVSSNLTHLQSWIKQARANFNVALERRYGEQARSALLQSGRNFGTTHIHDDQVRVTFELSKEVEWNQELLLEIVEEIAETDKQIWKHLNTKVSISEAIFKSWSPERQIQLSPARTVKPGSVSFKLAIVSE
ncbi:conserved hypothetical protein [Gammaproteobacteria bacterium]